MYPASGLGVDFFYADLPDAITINGTTYNKTVGDSNFVGSGSLAQFVSTDPIADFEDALWHDTESGDSPVWTLGASVDANDCLIWGDGNLTPGDDTVEDQFAGSYDVTYVEDEFTTHNLNVERLSLCLWQGAGPTQLQWNDTLQKWQVIYAPFWYILATKTGNQDTPVGTYEGTKVDYMGGTPENVTLTVSEVIP